MESESQCEGYSGDKSPETNEETGHSTTKRRGSGGRRRGSGRKMKYEGGYKKDLFWKNVSFHAEVFRMWVEVRESLGFKTNSDFARFLLENVKLCDSTADSTFATIHNQGQSRQIFDDFCPPSTSTPRRRTHTVKNMFSDTSREDLCVQNRSNRTQHSMAATLGRERVFIDSVIRNASLSSIVVDDDSDDDSDDETFDVDEVIETSSESCDSVADLQDDLNNLEISYDNAFLDHDYEADCNLDSTNTECVEMDISAISETVDIECNIPAMSFEQQGATGGNNEELPLLANGYEHKLATNIGRELSWVNEKKFVCSRSKILELFSECKRDDCSMPMVEVNESFCGCTMEIKWRCAAGHSGEWESSDRINMVYVNNLQAGAALLFTGNNFTKMSLFSKCFQLSFISSSTFHRYQKKYLARTVADWWDAMQVMILSAIGDKPVVVCGDGQMDSPGFCAKNCTYTLMDASTDYILGVEVVDVRHAQNKSSVMEKVGCERALDALMGKINIAELVTDASSQIIKLIATSPKYKDVNHQLDIWHKSNKLDKKLNEAGKKKGNEVLQKWVPAIRNHFWHCAKDCNGNVEKMKIMWVNLLKHVTNQHKWYNGMCSHGPLEQGEKEWIQQDSAPMQALREIVLEKKFLKSLPFYTHFRHTGKLESYHSHRLMYAPKRFGFSYEGTITRSLLAVIDHNHHLGRKQAKNNKGEPVFSRRWSKRTKRWKVVVVKEKKNYSHLPILCARAINALRLSVSQPLVYQNDPKTIAPTIAALPAPSTANLVQEHISRY